MEMKDQNVTKSTSQSRRKFLMRTGVGLVVASLPARSVWAGSGGIAQSIVASGHGSDFANNAMALKDANYISSNHSLPESRFRDVFNDNPIGANNNNVRLNQILTHPNGVNGPQAGTAGVNFYISLLYVNALFSESDYAIHYPIVGSDKPFKTFPEFADHLYSRASQSPFEFAAAVETLF